jgi:hypothetical protein
MNQRFHIVFHSYLAGGDVFELFAIKEKSSL